MKNWYGNCCLGPAAPEQLSILLDKLPWLGFCRVCQRLLYWIFGGKPSGTWAEFNSAEWRHNQSSVRKKFGLFETSFWHPTVRLFFPSQHFATSIHKPHKENCLKFSPYFEILYWIWDFLMKMHPELAWVAKSRINLRDHPYTRTAPILRQHIFGLFLNPKVLLLTVL